MRRLRLTAALTLLSSALLVGWWWSPYSPVAFDRPAAALAGGDAEGALAGYRALAAAPIPDRDEAMWQAALIAEVELARIDEAVALLESCMDLGGPRAAEAAARLARLAPDPLLAAEHWMVAADLEPDHPESGRWLLNAGEAALTAEDQALAEAALFAATERAESAVLAWLLLGRAALESDPATAHVRYDAALTAGAEGVTADLARSGREAAATLMEDGTTLADALEAE
ncbi:MAG: tetratricopeptide (TPR) repeat protein [Myxococcota bacterium]|jgi:tetratricopeptide (TPR) repeat protein